MIVLKSKIRKRISDLNKERDEWMLKLNQLDNVQTLCRDIYLKRIEAISKAIFELMQLVK